MFCLMTPKSLSILHLNTAFQLIMKATYKYKKIELIYGYLAAVLPPGRKQKGKKCLPYSLQSFYNVIININESSALRTLINAHCLI
jgi:hypothetical protein